MTEFEWTKQMQRGEVATLLRQIADGLEEDGSVELEQDGWELKLSVPADVELELELEIDGDGGELEIELKWADSEPAASSDESSEDAEAPIEIS